MRGRVDLYYGLTVVWLDTPQRAGVFAIRAAKCAMKSDTFSVLGWVEPAGSCAAGRDDAPDDGDDDDDDDDDDEVVFWSQ